MDINELMRNLKLTGADPSTLAAISRLKETMTSAQGQQLAQGMSRDTAARIERAAQAAQAGDTRAAQAAVSEILSTPEGAALAARLKGILGK